MARARQRRPRNNRQKSDKSPSDSNPRRRRKPKKLCCSESPQPSPQCASRINLRRHTAATLPAASALARSTHPTSVAHHRAHYSPYMADENEQNDSGPHPLQFKWTLWHDFVAGKNRNATYAANLRPIASFDTVEDFWAVFNSLKEPSQLPANHTYNLFKFGIDPKWEDPQNVDGGEWRVGFPSAHTSHLDKCWINTILTVIGEGFGPQESDDIAGIVMNRRRGGNRVAIWTKTAMDEDLQNRIGRRWRETSAITYDQHFLQFKDSIGTTKKAKPRFTLS